MKPFRYLCASAALGVTAALGLRHSARQAAQRLGDSRRPNEVVEFGTLVRENCAGCHGAEGRGGAAIALADPVYLGIVDEATMRKVIAERRARHLDAGLRAKRRRNADRQAD